ncbi:MAG: AGE family epimerase/isomerase [Acidimicrobiia bacterium]
MTRSELESYASKCRPWVRDGMLPYWRRTGIDPRYGGYRLRDYGAVRWARFHRWRARRCATKHVMSHARLVWVFSHAQLAGWTDPSGADLDAARNGYEFLVEHFWDAEYGGWRSETARDGGPRDERKSLCGQVAMLLALVEYVRATGDVGALGYANETFDLIESRFRDQTFGGWTENLSRDWQPVDADERPMVDRIGVKSANVNLHVMEALAELGDLTGDPRVLVSLGESVDIMRTRFLTDDPSQWVGFRENDWSFVDDPDALMHSYGHAVEHAWLSIRAEQVLGREPSWDYFFVIVDHALRFGFDHERGGLYTSGPVIGPATNEEKQWWGQAEMIAALTDASVRCPDGGYDVALLKTAEFVHAHFADPSDGVWFDTVAADGTVLFRRKAHDWQSSYHDARALVKFAGAYAP